MTTVEIRTELLRRLRGIQDSGPENTGVGICSNVVPVVSCNLDIALKSTLEKLIAAWPDKKFSYRDYFPVEGTRIAYVYDDYKWQNPRRIALLDWLISQLEEQQHD